MNHPNMNHPNISLKASLTEYESKLKTLKERNNWLIICCDKMSNKFNYYNKKTNESVSILPNEYNQFINKEKFIQNQINIILSNIDKQNNNNNNNNTKLPSSKLPSSSNSSSNSNSNSNSNRRLTENDISLIAKYESDSLLASHSYSHSYSYSPQTHTNNNNSNNNNYYYYNYPLLPKGITPGILSTIIYTTFSRSICTFSKNLKRDSIWNFHMEFHFGFFENVQIDLKNVI